MIKTVTFPYNVSLSGGGRCFPLFTEHSFRFIPKIGGWTPSLGQWHSGKIYLEAYKELLNLKKNAVQSGSVFIAEDYKQFSTIEVYNQSLTTNNEANYYVIDEENQQFKTPVSRNFVRYTDDLSKLNIYVSDALQTHTHTYRTDQNWNRPRGDDRTACFTYDFNTETSAPNNARIADETRPKSHYEIMCVYLGEVDYSPVSSVNDAEPAEATNINLHAAIAQKIDVDGGNIPLSLKNEITVWGAADWSKKIGLGQGSSGIADKEYWLIASCTQPDRHINVTVNGITFLTGRVSQSYGDEGVLSIPVNKGNSYKVNTLSQGVCYLLPLKGQNE